MYVSDLTIDIEEFELFLQRTPALTEFMQLESINVNFAVKNY